MFAAKAIKESLKDLKSASGNGKKESKKEESSADDGFAMMPATRKKLLDTLAKGQSGMKRLDEIFAAREASNARQLPGENNFDFAPCSKTYPLKEQTNENGFHPFSSSN